MGLCSEVMMRLGYWCCVTLLFNAVFGSVHDTNALLFIGDGKFVQHKYLRILHVERDFLLIGAKANMYNVSTQTLEVNQEFDWVPSNTEIEFCQNEIVKFKGECNSYVRSVVKENDTFYRVCASSAKKPTCRNLVYSQGNWSLEMSPKVGVINDVLAPIFPWTEIRKLVTQDTHTLYVAGHYLESATNWHPLIYRRTALGANGSEVAGLRSYFSQSLFKIDYNHERSAEFKGIFETEDYVFFTFVEHDLETSMTLGTQMASYSRVARVCKNDFGRGTETDAKHQFATLFKTRLLCGNAEYWTRDTQKYYNAKLDGYYGSYIDDLADSTTPHISSVTGAGGEEIILAIFNSPRSSVKTSAICAYRVSDLNRVFDNSPQMELGDRSLTVKHGPRYAARCYPDSRQMPEESRDYLNDFLLYMSVKPLGNNSLFMDSVDYRMTQVAVDWQVEAADGNKYDVIFISTDDGRVIKFVKYLSPGETEEKYHPVEERYIFPGKPIHEMRLIHDGTKKHLLVNTLEQVKRIALEKCHFYTNCSACLALRDPYCSWSPSLSRCVSTTHEANDKYQNISSGVSAVCEVIDSDNSKDTTTENTLGAELPRTGQSKIGVEGKAAVASPFIIALLVVLPILFGVVLFVVGYVFGVKRRGRSPTHHLDELSTNKSKTDLNTNCDAYQQLPKQSNLQLMNNLNGKAPNVETASMGEMTLTRHKQVYL